MKCDLFVSDKNKYTEKSPTRPTWKSLNFARWHHYNAVLKKQNQPDVYGIVGTWVVKTNLLLIGLIKKVDDKFWPI